MFVIIVKIITVLLSIHPSLFPSSSQSGQNGTLEFHSQAPMRLIYPLPIYFVGAAIYLQSASHYYSRWKLAFQIISISYSFHAFIHICITTMAWLRLGSNLEPVADVKLLTNDTIHVVSKCHNWKLLTYQVVFLHASSELFNHTEKKNSIWTAIRLDQGLSR